ncbi:MAG: glycosyltransferase [Coleofasciculaceae cyanobacterium]
MPKVSVIIPVYNGEKTILKTIQSVQEQTFSNFEIIVINDGSTDGTLEQVSTVQDSRIKIFSYTNGGLSVARNRGISHATGEFLTFLDADDLWTPDKLELQLAALQAHPEAGLAYSWTVSMDEKGEKFHPGISVSYEGNVYRQLLLGNFIASGSNAMLRKQAIESAGEFDPTLKSIEDWDYWLRVVPHWSFVVVPKPQILYRQSSSSMSAKVEKMEKCALIVVERAFQSAPQELQHLKSQSLAFVYHYSAELWLRHSITNRSDFKEVNKKLWMAIQFSPKILLTRKMQVLLIKWLLHQIIPTEVANSALQFIKKVRATPIQKIQTGFELKV